MMLFAGLILIMLSAILVLMMGMRVFVGIILGAFSAFLLHMMATIIVFGRGGQEFSAVKLGFLFLGLFFLINWVVSSCLLVRGAKTVGKVFNRACLLGAGEWLLLIIVSFIFGPPVWFQATRGGFYGGRSMIIGPGIMALVCLAGFALSRFGSRETAPEPVIMVKRCGHCGQVIESQARFCSSCGASFQAS